ncbi:MAG: hypothetical protein FWB72_04825, partial [Firmicutes bacterium]|nr:hypothetical protein [Bacillota bacterium]
RAARDLRVGDYIQNFGGRKWRVIGHDTDGSVTGQVGAPLLRTDSAEDGQRRFHSTNDNFWITSELRSYLNGAFFNDNFSAAHRAMVIPNVRLETIRTSPAATVARYNNALAAGQIEQIINGSGWATAPSTMHGARFGALNASDHNTRHRYSHRDTVFILCAQQTYNLNSLGLRYGNTAGTADGGTWQISARDHVSDHFAWPRRRDYDSGDANRVAATAWTRSPVVSIAHSLCLLVPRVSGLGCTRAGTNASGNDWCTWCGGSCSAFTGSRTFAPALYINPSTIFRFARNTDTERNEQSGFRVYDTLALARPSNVRLSGDTLLWNSVTNADGYRVYRGSTLVQAVGNVTSFNLSSHANIPVGTQATFSVSATNSTAGRAFDSARGGSVLWGQLNTPTGVSVSGSVISWNSVPSATGYQIRLGNSVIATLGNVTSHNLSTIPVSSMEVGAHSNINVVAISSAASWGNSAGSANVSFTRAEGLHSPHNVAINGSVISWDMNAITLPFVNNFNIVVGDTVLATVASTARSFDLSDIPVARTESRNMAVAGSLGSLQAGLHNISIVAVNNSAAWPNSEPSVSAEYYRAARVDSISISGNPNLIVGWPRPAGINYMPTSQLVANVVGLYGSDKSVFWSSSNPDIVSVDAASGFIRASWPSGLSMWELAARNHNTFTVITARSALDSSVVAQLQVLVVFETPPVPIVVGVEVSGGFRDIEIAPCGTRLADSLGGGALVDATQFVATAFGYNLAGAGNVFSWASSDSGVATIDSAGRLSVRGVGITRITATSSIGDVPYSFYVTISRDGAAVATDVTILCDNSRSDERRLVKMEGSGVLPYVDLVAFVEGHNITSQLVTWASSCGAVLGSPSLFLEFSLTAEGIRVRGLAAASHIIITATPVGAIGVVGTFRIFVDVAVAPVVTSVSIGVPSVSELVVPNRRPILTTDLPSVQLSASTVGGVGGGTGSSVLWTVYPLGFVEVLVSGVDPNVVVLRAVDRGSVGFSQVVTITATSSITPSQFASRQITIVQGAITGIDVSVAIGGGLVGEMFLPYAPSSVYERHTLDLRAVVAVNSAGVSQAIRWETSVLGLVMLNNLRTEPSLAGLDSLVTLRPLAAGVLTIWAVGVYCGVVSNKFEIEVLQASPTSVRIFGPNESAVSYQMAISLPRPADIDLPIVQLGASVGGSFAAGRNLEWTSSCGGAVVEFLGSTLGSVVLVRAVNLGVATLTATHTLTGFYATFVVSVEQARLDSIEILGDGVVREQTAMLIPLVYVDGAYMLSEVATRQMLTLSLVVATFGEVATDFVWTSRDSGIVRIVGVGENASKITDRNGFVSVLPYGVGRAVIRAVSTLEPSFYAEFVIYVTRGSASCSIQDGILDLPSIAEGYIRLILVCEHYFAERMLHIDLTLEQAMYFVLPTLELGIENVRFLGWALSRGAGLLAACESGYVRVPAELFDSDTDTILLFAVWYVHRGAVAGSDSGLSNFALYLIISSLCIAGAGAAGTAGYISQSRTRARRESGSDEWGMDN